jgi:hypothetical protein
VSQLSGICAYAWKESFADNPIALDEWKAKEEGVDVINKHYSFEEKNRYFN